MYIVDELLKSGDMGLYVDYRTGSTLDIAGNCTPTVTGSPKWMMTEKGYGLEFRTGQYISYGNPVSLQVQSQTLFAVSIAYNGLTYRPIFGRMGAPAEELTLFTNTYQRFLWIFPPGATYGPLRYGYENQVCFVACSAKCGAIEPNAVRFIVNGMPEVNAINSCAATGTTQNWYVGGSPASNSSDQIILLAGMVKRRLSSAEMQRLYNEWLTQSFPSTIPRRNFTKPYPGLTAAECTARSTALDMPMKRISNRSINLASTAYNPTMAGNIDTSSDDTPLESKHILVAPGGTSHPAFGINCGNVSEMNGASALTISLWLKIPSYGVINGNCIFGKYDPIITGNNISMWLYTASPGPHTFEYTENYGGGIVAYTRTSGLRSGVWHHFVFVKDGSGTGDFERLKIYLDGKITAYTSMSAAFQATCPNPGAQSLIIGGFNTTSYGQTFDIASMRIEARAWSQAEVTKEYLQAAQKPHLIERGDDILVGPATFASGNIINSLFDISAGTWNVRQDATNKYKYFVRTAGVSGVLSTPSKQVKGTWYFRARADVSYVELYMLATTKDPAVLNGYLVLMSRGSGIWQLQRTTGGARGAVIGSVGAQAAGVVYDHCVTRDVNGLFKLYVRGGAYTTWTLLGQGTDNDHWASNYCLYQAFSDDQRFVISQNGGKDSGFTTFTGVLNPMLGELPVGAKDFNPFMLPNLKGFWLAETGVTNETGVRVWQDISGNGNHWKQTTTANQPTYSATSFNSRAGITFDGTNDFLTQTSLASTFSGTDVSYTVIMAAQYVAVPAANKYAMCAYGVTAEIDIYADGAAGDYINMKIDDAATSATQAGGAPDTSRHVFSDVCNGTTITKYVDSISVLTGAQDVGLCTITDVCLGTYRGSAAGTYNANFRIAGMIVCSGALSNTDRAAAEAWLSNYCGV